MKPKPFWQSVSELAAMRSLTPDERSQMSGVRAAARLDVLATTAINQKGPRIMATKNHLDKLSATATQELDLRKKLKGVDGCERERLCRVARREFDRASGALWGWSVYDANSRTEICSGAVISDSLEQAMVAVRGAAIADGLPRPLEILITRKFLVVDRTVQDTVSVDQG